MFSGNTYRDICINVCVFFKLNSARTNFKVPKFGLCYITLCNIAKLIAVELYEHLKIFNFSSQEYFHTNRFPFAVKEYTKH